MKMENFVAPRPKEGEPYDTIIIGSGPAGLAAAVYTTRGALSTLVLGGAKWGGQLMLTTEVDNYPGFPEGVMGPELMEKFRAQAARFGAEVKLVDVEDVDFSRSASSGQASRLFRITADGQTYQGKSVIIATGADSLWLGIPSERKLIGRGVSSCAPCDAPFFKDKNVVVVGGGDSAMEEALVLTKYATSVTIVHRRDVFRASDIMQQKVLASPKIKVVWNSEVVEIMGDMKVTGIKIKNNQMKEVSQMQIDGVFVAIGHAPSTKIFQGKIELDEKGYVLVRDHTKTSVEGVFVAGDVHDYHYRQAVTAAGFGCMAAMDLEKWLGVNPATR